MTPPMNPRPPASSLSEGLPEDFSPREIAELYAAGALSPAEAAVFEAKLRAGEVAFVRAYEEVKPAMNKLLNIGETFAAPPPASVRASIMARLNAEVGVDAADDDPLDAAENDSIPEPNHATSEMMSAGITILRASTGRWTRTGLRGVKLRTLMADRKANRRTIMLDMAPGAVLPDHSHAGIEEVFMISGDLLIAGTVLRTGDYIRVERDADHGVPRTEGGCVCIVISDYVPFPLTSMLGFVWAALRSLFRRGTRGE